jgi:pyridoxamine 5'-phosphate oxidase
VQDNGLLNSALTNLRREYTERTLNEKEIDANPFLQFDAWFRNAADAQLPAANAMILATATREGEPSARVVLLKGIDDRGFLFFTSYESRKGRELKRNPRASLLFFWAELERQVRIEGTVEKTSADESFEYFRSRPRENRISAWASRQTEPVLSREVLEKSFAVVQQKFEDQEIPLPEHWGGYRVLPQRFEFWQGRTNRLHDRILYTRREGQWTVERLSP